MNFKIIALRILDGCKRESRKILKPKEFYYFLNGYTISENSIDYKAIISDDFYSRNKPGIIVSAIVGRNGSGKSSLIELFIQAINNLSIYFGIDTGLDVELVPGLELELYFQSDAYYKIVLRESVTIYRQGFEDTLFKKLDQVEFNYANFFFTIVVNYSNYGLNSRDMGEWIHNLFHKNDGYQTPILINPQKTEGNIDINRENSLAIARLMAAILTLSAGHTDGTNITEQLSANTLRVKLKPDVNPVLYTINEVKPSDDASMQSTITSEVSFLDLDLNQFDIILNAVNDKYNFGFKGHWETGDYIKNLAHNYIIRKLIRIAVTYSFYNKYFDKKKKQFDIALLNEFLSHLFDKNDNHISFKLKQTLNFLIFRHIDVNTHEGFDIKVPDLASVIDKIKKEFPKKDVIELIPPPIFEVDILMKSKTEDEIVFNTLSSGEKQLIYSVNAITYHLNNIDTVKTTDLQTGYQFINIILEEIELYFHPNLQREFVSMLLQRINQMPFQKITSINICFVTHSPFILSDIPNSNILFLQEDGYPHKMAVNMKTFGANIHDLLKHSFFMANGSMGAFAQERINITINHLNYKKLQNEIKYLLLDKEKNKTLIKRKEDELIELKGVIGEILDDTQHRELIKVIGEPILQRKLSQMYDEVNGERLELEIVQARIAELQKEEESLKNK